MKFIFKNLNFLKSKENRNYIIRFSKDFIAPVKYSLLIALIFMTIYGVSNASLAWIMKPIMDQVFVVKEFANIYLMGLTILFISIAKAISQYIYALILANIGFKVLAKAQNDLYSTFIKSDISFFHKNNPGSLTSSILIGTQPISSLAADIPMALGRDLITFISLLVVMFIQSPIFSLLILMVMGMIIFPINIVKRKLKQSYIDNNLGFSDYNTHLEQTFNGIKEVKTYAMEDKEITQSHLIMTDINKSQLKMRKASSLLPAITELVSGLCIGGVLIIGGYISIKNGTSPGTFVTLITSLMLAYQPFKRLIELSVKTQMGIFGIQRYYSFVDEKPSIVDLPNAKDIKIETPSIKFNDVSFSYEPDKTVLHSINLDIQPGKKIALVGESGGGKSTLLHLLLRFYEISSGDIIIGGHNLNEFTINSLRRNITLVNQDVTLFDDTVINNIKYSKPNATYDEILDAAIKANCMSWINKLPLKFDSQIGSRGTKLSGGQRQRLSIARAILKNSPILLLDEATSALDTESEKEVQKALDNLTLGSTSIVVAHRLSTIINSDIIFVLEEGTIVEQGSHEQLIKNNGKYKILYDLQFKNNHDQIKP